MDNLFLDPVRLVQMMRGRVPPTPIPRIDCDELTAFALGLALFIDLPAEIVTIAADPARPNQFSHVYLRLFTREGVPLPLDLTLGWYPGLEPPRVCWRRIWPVNTLVHPWEVSEADQPTAELVSVMIARAKASASQTAMNA